MPIAKETRIGNHPPTRDILPLESTFEVTHVSKDKIDNGQGTMISPNMIVVSEATECGVRARKFEEDDINAQNIRREIKSVPFLGRTIQEEIIERIIWVPEFTTRS